jgi:hypothetical protein
VRQGFLAVNLFARKNPWLASYKGLKHFILAWGLLMFFSKIWNTGIYW